MIAIIDYGVGNLFSLQSSFHAIGADVVVTADPAVIAAADRIILPGVGAFEDAIAKLRDKYGYSSVQRGVVLEDAKVNGLDIRGKKEETNSKNNPPMDEV